MELTGNQILIVILILVVALFVFLRMRKSDSGSASSMDSGMEGRPNAIASTTEATGEVRTKRKYTRRNTEAGTDGVKKKKGRPKGTKNKTPSKKGAGKKGARKKAIT